MDLKKHKWEFIFGLSLIILSLSVYFLHYFFFHDLHHILIYSLEDLAFLPLEVLLVVLILHRIIENRETQKKLEKLNVVINAFFSEVGNELLKELKNYDIEKKTEKYFENISEWNEKDFIKNKKSIIQQKFNIDSKKGDLNKLKKFLFEKRNFILALLENPLLFEHDRFTSLLWATLHLQEELYFRMQLEDLPDTDYAHLSGDIKRAYKLLIEEYIHYLSNLKNSYPYLYSLTVRMNPFTDNQSIVIK